jgi:transcriptional regulator with GAF, ATPase, and Fis domain
LLLCINFSWEIKVGENELIGQSAAMRDVRRLVEIAAPSITTILVLGATGTGKELVARNIHKLSSRKGDLISINCSAIPAELLESELFGYEKGAFTGAEKNSTRQVRNGFGGYIIP